MLSNNVVVINVKLIVLGG